jgi:ribosome-binding factor A
METKRQQRIAKMLQKDMGEIFQVEVRSLVAGVLVTVTKVNVTPDLSLARFYISIFGTDNKKALLQRINHQAGEIRGHLGRRARHQLRHIPEVQFFEDDSLDYIENIDNLLKDE